MAILNSEKNFSKLKKKMVLPTKILITWPIFMILSKLFFWKVTDAPFNIIRIRIATSMP